jgi:hypothetical protein
MPLQAFGGIFSAMLSEDQEEFQEELMDCLYAIQRQLESISATLRDMPHNTAYFMGYKPFPANPLKGKAAKPETDIE